MLIKLSTDKTVSDTSIGLQAAAQANRFDVIEIHDHKASMEKAGVKSARECLTFDICQTEPAMKVFGRNRCLSGAQAYRISVYEEGEKTFLAAAMPTALMALFNAPQLEGVAREVEEAIVKIMKEAAFYGESLGHATG